MSLPEFDLSSPFTSSSVIYYPASLPSKAKSTSIKLIFFVTGNPGLIAYYGPFFSSLNELLSRTHGPSTSKTEQKASSSQTITYAILGTSLANFAPSLLEPRSQGCLSLAEQTSLCRLRLETTCRRLQEYYSSSSPIEVLLMGHSVGAYIALSISSVHQSSLTPGPKSPLFDSTGAILLTPTISDIALSPSGKTFEPLSRIPNFPNLVGIFVGLLTALMPTHVVSWIIANCMRFPPHISRPTAELTRDWGRGVREALHLAKDEMKVIRQSQWDEVIWHADMKTVCYYVEKDHWVPDKTRDELLAKQSARMSDTQGDWPKIVLDSSGVGHGFCIYQSKLVAEKVASWIEEMAKT